MKSNPSNRRKLLLAAVILAISGHLATASAQTPFYDAPKSELAGEPGTLVRDEIIDGAPDFTKNEADGVRLPPRGRGKRQREAVRCCSMRYAPERKRGRAARYRISSDRSAAPLNRRLFALD